MCDHDPNDETVLPAGGLPLPPSTISAELARKLRLARAEVHTMPNSAARLYGDAADAIEALTAENAIDADRIRRLEAIICEHGRAANRSRERIEALTASLSAIGEAFGCHPDSTPQAVAATVIKRAEELKAGALAELTAENVRLKGIEEAARAYVGHWTIFTQPPGWADERNRCAFRLARALTVSDASATTDHGWCATHRAKVEADFATAKDDEAEGLRPLSPDEIEAGSYLLTRAKAGSIDMALLGELCREEPDADTKREVAEMMDGLTGRIGAQP